MTIKLSPLMPQPQKYYHVYPITSFVQTETEYPYDYFVHWYCGEEDKDPGKENWNTLKFIAQDPNISPLYAWAYLGFGVPHCPLPCGRALLIFFWG